MAEQLVAALDDWALVEPDRDKERRLLEVARRAGFGDDERMRRAFMRHLGISPSEYRSRFAG